MQTRKLTEADVRALDAPSVAKQIRSIIAMALVEIEQEFSELTPAGRADLIVSRLVERGFDVTELDLNA